LISKIIIRRKHTVNARCHISKTVVACEILENIYKYVAKHQWHVSTCWKQNSFLDELY